VLSAPRVLTIGGGEVTNFEGEGGGKATLRQATLSSINTVFAQLGVTLGPARLVAQARAYGFDAPLPIELPVSPSVMPDPGSMTAWETAWAAVGQPVGANAVRGPVATAMQMALVAAGVANGGVVMRPYLVDHVSDAAGEPVQTASPRALTTATDPTTAATVRQLMIGVVDSGSGTRARIAGVTIAGKTGTAEVGKGLAPDAWFIAFEPATAGATPRIAVAIVLENAGVGGVVAAPAAREVLLAGLGR
jgi:peptidoglycan glycosyltransferase